MRDLLYHGLLLGVSTLCDLGLHNILIVNVGLDLIALWDDSDDMLWDDGDPLLWGVSEGGLNTWLWETGATIDYESGQAIDLEG